MRTRWRKGGRRLDQRRHNDPSGCPAVTLSSCSFSLHLSRYFWLAPFVRATFHSLTAALNISQSGSPAKLCASGHIPLRAHCLLASKPCASGNSSPSEWVFKEEEAWPRVTKPVRLRLEEEEIRTKEQWQSLPGPGGWYRKDRGKRQMETHLV